MSRKAKKQAKLSIQSGFRHHDMLSQQEVLTLLLSKHEQVPVSQFPNLNLDTYAHVLAPTSFRAMQNAVICFITIISRLVIGLGVSAEKSFALSDYFVYAVEEKKTRQELEAHIEDIISSFSDLLYTESTAFYSKKITKAIRYIEDHIYEPCTVTSVAEYLQINPRYFSTLFHTKSVSHHLHISNKRKWKKLIIWLHSMIFRLMKFQKCSAFVIQLISLPSLKKVTGKVRVNTANLSRIISTSSMKCLLIPF